MEATQPESPPGGGARPASVPGGGGGGGGHGGVPRVVAARSSVAEQAQLMSTAGTAWHAVKCGNLEMITKLFPNQCNVYAKGPVGENVLHVAMLLNTPSTLAISRYLVKLFGAQLVNCPIQERRSPSDPPGTYEGQTALHIAIVNRDFDMVKFLVQHRADIRARAWGTFFRAGGPMCYGEFPLSFAVSSGQRDVAAYLCRHGAKVNADRDAFGNGPLHLAVIHGQRDMFDFLVDYCGADEALTNAAGLTPLVLAAQLGRADMLRHIIARRRRTFYSFGRVTSYSQSLHEIDTVQDAAASRNGGYVPNVLEVVVRKRHLGILQEPLLHTLLASKWEAFGRAQFLAHFLGYLVLEVSQTLLIWLISDQEHWNGAARASQEFVSLALAVAMLAVEVADFANWSRECYHRRLTMSAHNTADPPLYPIPGEMRDVRDGRQGLFARLSARIGFHSSSTHGPAPLAGYHPSLTHSASRASDPGSLTPPPSSKQQQQPQQQAPPPRRPNVRQQQQQLVELQQQQQRVSSRLGQPSPLSVVGSDTSQPLLSQSEDHHQHHQQQDEDAASTAAQQMLPSPFSSYAGSDGMRSPRNLLSRQLAPLDEPINLDAYGSGGGSVVVGDGRSQHGVGVVDSGMRAAAAGGGPAASTPQQQQQQRAASSPPGAWPSAESSGSSSRAGRPLGEGRDEPEQQQQQAAATATGDDDDDVDVVSVGLPVHRVRSFASLSTASGTPGAAAAAGGGGGLTGTTPEALEGVLGSPVGGSSGATPLGARRSSAADAAAGGGPASGRPSLEGSAGGSAQQQQQQQRVTFSETVTNVVGDPRAASSISFTQQAPQSPPQQEQRDGTTTSSGGSGLQQQALQGGEASPALLAGAGAGAAQARSSPVPISRGGLGSRSFNGFPLGGSSGGDSGPGASALAASGRAATGDFSHLSPGRLSTLSTPLEAVSMLERQRTRIRSGGGDLAPGLGPGLALKRATLAKKASSAAAAAAAGDLTAAAATPGGGGGAAGGSGGGGVGGGQMSADSTGALHSLQGSRGMSTSPPASGRLPSEAGGPAMTSPPGSRDHGVFAAAAAAAGAAGGGLQPAPASSGLASWASGKLPWSGGFSDEGAGAGGGGGAGAGGRLDVERAGSGPVLDPHKTRLRALLETSYEGAVRMVEDPWLFVWHTHLALTIIHFVTWASSYGGIVGGQGPSSIGVREFDDVIVSMMGLSGWLAVIYFFRGFKPTGKLAYILERCIADVLKFVSLFVLWDLGFTLAFFTMQNGVLSVAPQPIKRNQPGITQLDLVDEADPFASIGSTMITLINMGAGLSHYDYNATCRSGYVLSTVMCTIYYLLWLATVILLLMNLLTAMIITTWRANQATSASHWAHRWALYVLKAERRLPASWVQARRLGTPSWDPKAQAPVYSHVFETVDEEPAGPDSSSGSGSGLEGQIRALEGALEDLRRRRAGGGGGGS